MKMQDKEVLEQAEEGLTSGHEVDGSKDSKESVKERRDSTDDQGISQSKKDQTKDGKFAFKKLKQPKKEKKEKNVATKFEGEGVSFKAKLIGVENVLEPRGDKMCQEAMQRLKTNVRNLGPHKRKINICVSLQGIKIKDEKSGDIIYHHPVALISFISQDITDARAFGYVSGSTNGEHQFFAIKTEKPAFNVVVALRDLFQTVLTWKQEKMDQVKEKKVDSDATSSIGSGSIHEKTSVQESATDSVSSVSEEEKSIKEDNIYFDVILSEPFQLKEPEIVPKTVDDLLGLQDELNKLQQGIEQMDTSIAAATYTPVGNPVANDPFDTSFVTPGGPKIDVFPQAMPAPVPVAAGASYGASGQALYQDKYAVFSDVDSGASIFESASDPERPLQDEQVLPDMQDLEKEIKFKSMAPAKPPRNVKSPTSDLSFFADLDPLGKDRPYKDKAEFFQDVKNPPKKVLNDLVDKSSSSNGEDFASRAFDVPCGTPPHAFPMSSPPTLGLASSLPNSFVGNLKFSVAYPQNGNPYNPFDGDANPSSPVALTTRGSEPTFETSSCSNGYHMVPPPTSAAFPQGSSSSSSPIPIPSRQMPALSPKDRSYSNSSIGSPCSKSPMSADNGSPPFADIGGGNSPVGLTMASNGFHSSHDHHDKPLTNGHSSSERNQLPTNSHNGVSRPRPRASLSKGPNNNSNNGLVLTTHRASIPSSDRDVRSNGKAMAMPSIAHVLRANGLRARAGSLPAEKTARDFKIPTIGNGSIFAKKNDPFGDDFFCSVPKNLPNTNNLVSKELRDYL